MINGLGMFVFSPLFFPFSPFILTIPFPTFICRVGWGVGGIEAEAVMLGQPISMVLPAVVGYKLVGRLSPLATATDLVLLITKVPFYFLFSTLFPITHLSLPFPSLFHQNLRAKGVVDKFVEFYGPGVATLSLADRATISNMVGSTLSLFYIQLVHRN